MLFHPVLSRDLFRGGDILGNPISTFSLKTQLEKQHSPIRKSPHSRHDALSDHHTMPTTGELQLHISGLRVSVSGAPLQRVVTRPPLRHRLRPYFPIAAPSVGEGAKSAVSQERQGFQLHPCPSSPGTTAPTFKVPRVRLGGGGLFCLPCTVPGVQRGGKGEEEEGRERGRGDTELSWRRVIRGTRFDSYPQQQGFSSKDDQGHVSGGEM